jgi:hypothetical protein
MYLIPLGILVGFSVVRILIFAILNTIPLDRRSLGPVHNHNL